MNFPGKKTGLRLALPVVILIVFFTVQLIPADGVCGEITLTDMAGRKVILPGPARTVVTTFKPATLSVFCLGLAGRIVGVDNSSSRDRLHQAVYPDIARAQLVGSKSSGLNLETLLSLKPDLVVLYAQKDGISMADRLTGIGIPAIIIQPESFDSLKETLHLIGRAAGVPERAEKAVHAIDDTLKLVNSRVAYIPEANRKSVYYASPRGVFSTAPGSMLQSDMILKAGGINVAGKLSGYFRNISPEQLVAWNPDIILVSGGAGMSAATSLIRPEFSEISGVAGGRVFGFPSDIAPWDFPSPLSALGVLWMGMKFYPERFEGINMKEYSDGFHMALFGKTLSGMGGSLSDRVME